MPTTHSRCIVYVSAAETLVTLVLPLKTLTSECELVAVTAKVEVAYQ